LVRRAGTGGARRVAAGLEPRRSARVARPRRAGVPRVGGARARARRAGDCGPYALRPGPVRPLGGAFRPAREPPQRRTRRPESPGRLGDVRCLAPGMSRVAGWRASAKRVETRHMARRRTKRVLKPRAPSRVRKKRAKTKKPRGHQHPELLGLALVAFGLFLASVLWAGWNGGYVGGWIGDGFVALVGGLAFVLPLALVIVGRLMVGPRVCVGARPCRTGLVIFALGLLLTLGTEGGYLGSGLSDALGAALGGTGVAIVGVLCLLAGALLLTGASAGALIRRTATAARRPLARPQRDQLEPVSPEPIST